MAEQEPCERSGMPVFIDHKAVCHACGRAVPVTLSDGLWCLVPHNDEGIPIDLEERTVTE